MGILVLYFLYWTKDWQPWFYVVTVMQVLVLIGMLMLPESPQFYFAKGRFDEAKMVLLRIAAVNGSVVDESMICFDKVGHEGDSSDTDEDSDLVKGSIHSSINDIGQAYAKHEKPSKETHAKHCEGTLKELFTDRDLVVNLFLMAGLWSICSFTYYLGKF